MKNKVNVYEGEKVIAKVEYNSNLDFWDGHNWTCGGTGLHKGLTKLKDGRYVLIHGSQWQGQSNHAEIISAEEAAQEILHAEKDALFDEYPELKEIRDKTLIEEA